MVVDYHVPLRLRPSCHPTRFVYIAACVSSMAGYTLKWQAWRIHEHKALQPDSRYISDLVSGVFFTFGRSCHYYDGDTYQLFIIRTQV